MREQAAFLRAYIEALDLSVGYEMSCIENDVKPDKSTVDDIDFAVSYAKDKLLALDGAALVDEAEQALRLTPQLVFENGTARVVIPDSE